MSKLITIVALYAGVVYSATTTESDCSSSTFSSVLSNYPTQLKITNTTYHASNSFKVAEASNNVAFCAVDASLSYGNNSTLLFSLWLPDKQQYQGRFLAVGNGGLAGVIDQNNMLAQLNAGLGFAVAGGDAGHSATANNNGAGQPGVYLPFLHDQDQTTVWIHNAISLFTPAAKALTEAFYGGEKPKYSYYNGCSTGGAQGFALAQYHPELYDGIVAGSPGNWYSHLALSFLWNARQTNTSATQLPQASLDLITNAVLKACDGNDGVFDGLIENPLTCQFDINTLSCSNGASPNCLTAAQLQAVESIYQGPVSCDGTQIYPGFTFGSESEWSLQEGYLAKTFSIPILQNLVYNNLSYDASTFDFSPADVDDMDTKAGELIDEQSLDLSAFRKRKGKMLVTQGWTDAFNAAAWPIQYLEQAQRFFGGDISDFFSLFMIPGGGHCGSTLHNTAVPAIYHIMEPLVKWVESGIKPDYVLSTNPPDGSSRTRRLCPWPQTANYVSGDKNQSTSYTCT